MKALRESALLLLTQLSLRDGREFLKGLSGVKRSTLDLGTLRCEGESFIKSKTRNSPSERIKF